MHYMVELHYSPEHRDAALKYFLDHGATHYEGNISVESTWVATRDHVAYALVRTRNSNEVEKATKPLKKFGTIFFRHVTSTDEI